MNIEINLDDNKKVYMKFNKKTTQYSVPVMIKSDLFKKLWRNTMIHKDIANGNEETWLKDEKYHWAEKGFSKGIENPVPLADIGYSVRVEKEDVIKTKFFIFKKHCVIKEKTIHSLGFSDGITRTIWLLCNGAKEIPFSMSVENTSKLMENFKDEVKILGE